MQLSDRYKWEAERKDGTMMNSGGDLLDCVRFSLIPQLPWLPQHDLVGLPLVRRFCRVIHKVALSDWKNLPGMFMWENGSNVVGTTEDLREILSPGSMIRKRHDGEDWWPISLVEADRVVLASPYTGRTKKIESKVYIKPPSSEYLHCVVSRDFRLYVKASDGTVLVTPSDYELYL